MWLVGSTGRAPAWIPLTCTPIGGCRGWPVAGRPLQVGQQEPPDLRQERSPSESHHDRRQRPRHRRPDPHPGRRRPIRGRPSGAVVQRTQVPSRGEGLQQSARLLRADPPPDPACHLPPWRTRYPRPRQAPLRGVADLRPATPVQAPRRLFRGDPCDVDLAVEDASLSIGEVGKDSLD